MNETRTYKEYDWYYDEESGDTLEYHFNIDANRACWRPVGMPYRAAQQVPNPNKPGGEINPLDIYTHVFSTPPTIVRDGERFPTVFEEIQNAVKQGRPLTVFMFHDNKWVKVGTIPVEGVALLPEPEEEEIDDEAKTSA